MNHQSKVRRSLLLAVFVLAVATSPVMAGADPPVLTVTKGSRISVDADNQPLNVLLRMMAEKRLFNIRGGAAGDESLTLHFANLTLPEVLSKILRGYNYVVIDQGKNQPPVLTVMGRIQKGASPPMRIRPPPAPPAEPGSYALPEPPAASATSQPGLSPRQPAAHSPGRPGRPSPPGEAGRQTGQKAPAIQPDQAAGSAGKGAEAGGRAARQRRPGSGRAAGAAG